MLIFVLMLVCQALIWNYADFSQYLTLCFLPAMILWMPVERNTLYAMIVAFLSGFAVDFFAGGMLGLSSLALVPVALLRRPIIILVFGSEVISRGDNLSSARHGLGKMALAVLLCSLLFFVIYVWADGAGTRPFGFNVLRVAISLAASVPVSLLLEGLFSYESGSVWR